MERLDDLPRVDEHRALGRLLEGAEMDIVHDTRDCHRAAVHAQRGADGGAARKVVLGVRLAHEHWGTGLGALVEPAPGDEVRAQRA